MGCSAGPRLLKFLGAHWHIGIFKSDLDVHTSESNFEELQMKLTIAALLAFNLMTLGAAHTYAANIGNVTEDRAEAKYDATKDSAKSQYNAAKKGCRKLSGNAKDVCMKDAKAAMVNAKAKAKATEKSETAYGEAAKDSNKANYKAAKERCDSMSGKSKDACVGEAKMKYHQ